MRLFIESEVPVWDEFYTLIKEIRRLERRAKPVSEKQLHITYKFLGDVPEDRVDDIKVAMNSCLSHVEPFEATLRGLGVFPDMNRARVIWAGLEPEDYFREIASRIEEAMVKIGFPADKRAFHPHITLARVKAPHGTGAFRSLLREWGRRKFIDLKVDSVILKKSVLLPSGPEYSDVYVKKLE